MIIISLGHLLFCYLCYHTLDAILLFCDLPLGHLLFCYSVITIGTPAILLFCDYHAIYAILLFCDCMPLNACMHIMYMLLMLQIGFCPE